MAKTKRKVRPEMALPKVSKGPERKDSRGDGFPLDHYSYSSLVKFSTNPFMFKVNKINGDRIDSTRNVSGVIGNAFHAGLEKYYGRKKEIGEAGALKESLEGGMEFLEEYPDGFIEFSTSVPAKQKAREIFAFALQQYVQEKKDDNEEVLAVEQCIEASVDVEWKGMKIKLPVPLKGYVDKVVRDVKKRIKIKDYKTVRAFSDPEKIDGAKILQSIVYFFLVYAEYGEAPHSMTFEEVKLTKNRDGNPQIREYEIVYAENDLFFDFFFRFYEDITRALNGEQVFVPNVRDFFDNEVAIVAYIHRLDVSEEKAKQMEKLKVDNITDLLKAKIEKAGNMRKLMKYAEKKFVSAKSLNYDSMETEEKIATKLMEHGMLVKFDSKAEGCSVDLYRFRPSIGLKMSKLEGYVADIEQVVGMSGVRILAPIPNTSLIGFEVPRKDRRFPGKVPAANGFRLAMGMDVMGETYRFNITKAPHMLVAGATGSGKSVFLDSIINQLAGLGSVDLHLYDPKMVELSRFKDEAEEYYCEAEDIYLALDGLVEEMNERYRILSDAGVRDISQYGGNMRRKFVVIDEFGDLTGAKRVLTEKVKTGKKFVSGPRKGQEKVLLAKTDLSAEISGRLLLLAQKARACGIHLIIATQRPSVDIITGSIKANFPTKACFRTAKAVDSKVVLDEAGAEKLLGKGDMIFSSDEGSVRLQGFMD